MLLLVLYVRPSTTAVQPSLLIHTAIMSLSVVGGLGSVLDVFFQMYGAEGHSTNQVVWLSTFPSLLVGIGNYIILPLALVCGRRPVMLLANLVLLGSLIGCALSQNWAQHFGLRLLLGFATGATESVRLLLFPPLQASS